VTQYCVTRAGKSAGVEAATRGRALGDPVWGAAAWGTLAVAAAIHTAAARAHDHLRIRASVRLSCKGNRTEGLRAENPIQIAYQSDVGQSRRFAGFSSRLAPCTISMALGFGLQALGQAKSQESKAQSLLA
jgi:hypothetical protein